MKGEVAPGNATDDSAASIRRLGWRMFWVGLIVRVLYMTLAHTFRFRPDADHFQFGWEMGRVGRALATGYGFSDPFDGHTGPTAWNPPLYPLLIGAVFRVFGVYTQLSSWVLLTLNSVFSAATAPAIVEIAYRCFAPKHPNNNSSYRQPSAASVALWSGWLWALYPAAMQYAVRWIWDMCLTTLVFTCIFVIALRVRGIGDPEPPTRTAPLWAAFGLLWGIIALSNSIASCWSLPVTGLWMLAGPARGDRVCPKTSPEQPSPHSSAPHRSHPGPPEITLPSTPSSPSAITSPPSSTSPSRRSTWASPGETPSPSTPSTSPGPSFWPLRRPGRIRVSSPAGRARPPDLCRAPPVLPRHDRPSHLLLLGRRASPAGAGLDRRNRARNSTTAF